jgi:hypothetical protein
VLIRVINCPNTSSSPYIQDSVNLLFLGDGRSIDLAVEHQAEQVML